VTIDGAGDFRLDRSVPGTLGVSGVLSFDTASAAWQEIRSAVAQGQVTQLDLAGVRRSDSAGLSCVVAVMAESARAGRPLQVIHMPAGLQALAQVCEVDRFID
jgi:phospholipid transport system transporter-binding protein